MKSTQAVAACLLVSATIASAFPAKRKTHLHSTVRQLYKETITDKASECLGYKDSLLLPPPVQDFVRAVTDIQIPLIVPQIRKELKNHKGDEKTIMIKNLVEEFVQKLPLDEFLTSQSHLKKRDLDYEFPNYMDSLYGGFGKK